LSDSIAKSMPETIVCQGDSSLDNNTVFMRVGVVLSKTSTHKMANPHQPGNHTACTA